MDSKTLLKQFGSDPGSAFLEVIRSASSPLGAIDIKRGIIEIGAKRADVDRHWKRLQPVLKLHPNVRMGSNKKYEWSARQQPAQNSLAVLAGNLLAKLPGWLAEALVQNVSRGLIDDKATDAGWADKEFEKARLVADLAVAVEVLRARGATIAEVADLFAEEAQRKRLWPIGQPGDTVEFDPASHDAEGGMPKPGAAVKVVRAGYVWRGGGEPIVAAKAAVTV